jgi:glycosyltransferase involved in cell wall biosynthesis
MNIELNKPAVFSTTRRLIPIPPTPRVSTDAKVTKILLLPFQPLRKGEGGLRTHGRFKSVSGAVDGTNPAPLITVITVTYNAARMLEQTILSVINQDYPNVEFIIIDGGSNDGTLDILRKYEHAIDYWVSEPDKGIFDAWNKGVSLSSGDWVAFLGADDIYLDGALDAYAAAIARNDDTAPDYISSRVNLMKGDKIVRVIGRRWNWRAFNKYMNVAHAGSLHHVRLFEKWSGFNLNYRICGDYELLLRPGADLRADYFDQPTVNMSIGGVSDANWRALLEMTRAKVHTGGRNIVLSYVEFGIAFVKWHIRRWLWY